MSTPIIILGIESSCDETAAAVVTGDREIKSNVTFSQIKNHMLYGGVVPEIAARNHLESIEYVIQEALCAAHIGWDHIQGIAATAGPGLIGGVMVGMTVAKTISLAKNIPFMAVNHLAGHALTARLTHGVPFPYLLLLVSGGHCQILIVHDILRYTKLGSTLDDAIGEAFDKVAKLLKLPYPGGPSIEKSALTGNPLRFSLPRPLIHHPDPKLKCSFSLSGLKTAVRQHVELYKQKNHELDADFVADMAASFQHTVADIILNRVSHAVNYCREHDILFTHLVIAGGVAANQFLGQRLKLLSTSLNVPLIIPPPHLCVDNAAMIAWAGIEKFNQGLTDPLDFKARPRWPLTEEK